MWIQQSGVTIRALKPVLEALGIQKRRLYDTRPTCATLCLMSGMNPVFIAGQLGHSVERLLSTYENGSAHPLNGGR